MLKVIVQGLGFRDASDIARSIANRCCVVHGGIVRPVEGVKEDGKDAPYFSLFGVDGWVSWQQCGKAVIDTPWDRSHGVRWHGNIDGHVIFSVYTGSHGGFYVPDELLEKVPQEGRDYAAAWSGSPNWFEEDCAWAYVVVAFKNIFDKETVEGAARTLEMIRKDGGDQVAKQFVETFK